LQQANDYPDHVIEHGLNDIKIEKLSEGQKVTSKELGAIMRLLLREILWCKLENPKKFFIHVGWDYYMYIGCFKDLPAAAEKTNASGLYIENFASPYLETR
jgi:hypothetical protein